MSQRQDRESGAAMADSQRRTELATRIEQRRQELGARADVSTRLRELSASGSHLPVPSGRGPRSPLFTLIIAASAVVALLVVAGIATFVVASGMWVQTQLSSPSITVEDFYSAVHQEDYQTAYSKFSTEAQNSLSEPKFEQAMRAADLVSGGVDTYSIISSSTKGSTTMVTVDVVRRGDTTMATVFQLTLVQEQQSWRIASIRQTGQTVAPTPSS